MTGSYAILASDNRIFAAILMADGDSSSNPNLGVNPDTQALWSVIRALDIKIDTKNDALAADRAEKQLEQAFLRHSSFRRLPSQLPLEKSKLSPALNTIAGSPVVIHSDNLVPQNKGKGVVPPDPQPNPYTKPFTPKCFKCQQPGHRSN
ncbi:hypothetical protein TIFTF001_038962 [Ficus carica]|uniref:CCHC-type domain-containing protein n=1 Tax=Ficus carica TaxID=3494 RepID=A0AA88E885_FICCA|nr:hypothetical protein TIFTF001_038954 [Ficus carica]GMN69912.1 hypothetical protein TIFTF001_038956 [Ficus carica]GMN69915.1 hypothetical protein TIFTF001_038960 [Ficus carica]GMN69918.1 hypothetical protein TIFTF001_038962 [Ficus carica]